MQQKPSSSMSSRFIDSLLWRVLSLVAALPQGLHSAIAWCGFHVWRLTARKARKVFQRNIAHIWQLPAHSSFARMFERQVKSSQIVTLLETLRGIFHPQQLVFDGLDELRATMGKLEQHGRGQIIASAHLGSWELAGLACTLACSRDVYALAKPPRSPHFLTLLERVRAKLQFKVIWTGKNKQLTKSMLNCLSEGNWLGFVMDQKPSRRQGPEVQFFGQPTPFVPGPASMAIHCDCPILGVFCVRVGPMRYRVISKVLLPTNHGEKDLHTLTQRLASEIEQVIRLYPEQWCWDYKRWVF